MAFEVYAHKQGQRGLLESPQTDLGFAQNPSTNQGIKSSQGIGIGLAAARLIPAGKQVFNTVIQATGDKRLQKQINRIGGVISFGITAATIGPLAAVGVEAARLIVNGIQAEIQETIDVTNQAYVIQKRGVAIDKFVGVGERID